jgi:3-phosphoshikimate 1-carboxyvinyltransferase
MVSPFAREPVEIKTGTITSRPYIEMTIETMIAFGGAVDLHGENHFKVSTGQRYRARRYVVEPDASGATYFFGAAAITGGRIRVDGLTQASTQGDIRFVEVLERMGCGVERAPQWIAVRGSRYLHGIDVDMNAMPDAALTLAVVACFVQGPTTIRNVGNLRLKETDRIQALKNELEKLGARVTLGETDIRIDPPAKVEPACIETYDDHRMAMSFALAGLGVPGIEIENPECVAKTFPTFWERIESLG